jgi:hypothetical protein
MLKLIAAFTMNVQVHYYALLASTGQEMSLLNSLFAYHWSSRPDRVKEKLRNGEITVAGDNWPVFLYHGYIYNKDDPWNGLFRSSLLITVCAPLLYQVCLTL